jgi:hypothetical protein
VKQSGFKDTHASVPWQNDEFVKTSPKSHRPMLPPFFPKVRYEIQVLSSVSGQLQGNARCPVLVNWLPSGATAMPPLNNGLNNGDSVRKCYAIENGADRHTRRYC